MRILFNVLSHHIVISSHTLDQEMNRRTQITVFFCICVVVIFEYYWHTTSHVHQGVEEKLPPLPKSQPQTADKEMMDEMMNETMDEDGDKNEGKIPSFPETLDQQMMVETMDEDGERNEEKEPSFPETLDQEMMVETMVEDEDSNEEKIPSFPETLPYPIDLKRIDQIQKALWVTHLYQFLRSLNKSISPQFNMVFGDSDRKETVLNWIIAAHVRLDPPLHNIMVLSIDQPLCDFLASKKLPATCIAVLPESFLNMSQYSYNHTYARGIRCRLVVLRLINFWGYDVASYDSDAILLRNPQPLYDSNPDMKLFSGSDIYPFPLSDLWGFTLCAGVLVLRNHPSTGMYTCTCIYMYAVNRQAIHSFRMCNTVTVLWEV